VVHQDVSKIVVSVREVWVDLQGGGIVVYGLVNLALLSEGIGQITVDVIEVGFEL